MYILKNKTQTDNILLHPEDASNIRYWSKKWGVPQRAVIDGILNTGTLDAGTVKAYVMKDSWLYHPVDGTMKILRNTVNLIF
jgi:hypothetical protein